jgi:NitT/TauT family transport system substrate-binding protein
MPRRALALAAILVLLAACGQPGTSPTGTVRPGPTFGSSADASPSSGALTPLTAGLGYIPSIQFAPFYLAQQRGYYTEAGLEVTFENKIDPDLITLVGQGAIDVGVADGTSVIPAVSQGIPIVYVATIYGQYPSVVFAKPSSGIESAADLAGKRIGIPGKYGSSWIMLQALLDSAGLTPDDVTIVEYPDFGQGVAVQQGAVDAATGFVNNEPVVLSVEEEDDADVLAIDQIIALPGPGLITGTARLDDSILRFRDATLRAMRDIASDPEVGLAAAFEAVPELEDRADLQRRILEATIQTWEPVGGDAGDFGEINREGWAASIDYLTDLGLVPNAVTVDQLVIAE